MKHLKFFMPILALFLLFAGTQNAHAKDPIYTGIFSSKALDGYDTVAYFTQSKPVKGSDQFTTEYNGAEWHFSSAENLNLFKENPTKYAPQYGGYCAFAMANDSFASGDPKAWSIVDGKLYLNYNLDVRERWLKDTAGYIADADKNWNKHFPNN